MVNAMDDIFYGKRVLTIIGVLGDKDVDGLLELAAFLGEDYIVTEPRISRKMDGALLASKLEAKGKNCTVILEPREAVAYAMELIKKETGDGYDVILCAGSLYLIGELRKWVYHEREKERENFTDL